MFAVLKIVVMLVWDITVVVVLSLVVVVLGVVVLAVVVLVSLLVFLGRRLFVV